MPAFHPYFSTFCQRTSHSWHRKQRINSHIWKAQLNSLTPITWQVHMCTPNKLYLFPLNISTSNVRRPVYLLTFLVAYSEIWTTDPEGYSIHGYISWLSISRPTWVIENLQCFKMTNLAIYWQRIRKLCFKHNIILFYVVNCSRLNAYLTFWRRNYFFYFSTPCI